MLEQRRQDGRQDVFQDVSKMYRRRGEVTGAIRNENLDELNYTTLDFELR